MIHFANGITIPEFDHPYNTTALNERAVELAMVQQFLIMRHNWEGRLGEVLEVGNVLSHYGDSITLPSRRIVDRFEVAPNVENIDVFDIEGTYDTIISISTIEHVGVDDGSEDPMAAFHAITFLRQRLAPGGRFLCTFPTGWNRRLDIFLGCGTISRMALSDQFFVRDGVNWVEQVRNPHGGFQPYPYGVTQPWAEAVWVGEFAPLVTNP